MIKNIKLFVNDNVESLKQFKLVKEKLIKNDFNVVKEDIFDLAIAIGGDGAFLRTVRKNNFNSDIYYVGINTGHLGFLQDINPKEVDKFIEELKEYKYKVDEIGIQETKVEYENKMDSFYTLNEIVVRDSNLDLLRANISIDEEFLENYVGDGIMIATSTGSTAYNLSYGGSIVYPSFSTLQITSMAPINSNRSRSMINSIIIPDKKIIKIIPENKKVIVSIDGANKCFNDVKDITSTIDNKKIKCLRFSHYSFPKKINEKLLS